MDVLQARDLIDRMRQLWPDWEPTNEQIRVWAAMLQPVEPGAASQAIDAHYSESHWKRPQLPGVLQKTRVGMLKTRRPVTEQPRGPEPTTWIQCVEHPTKPGLVGHFKPVLFNGQPPPNVVASAAHRFAAHHAEQYGGKWVVMEEASQSEMMRVRSQLQNTPDVRTVHLKCRSCNQDIAVQVPASSDPQIDHWLPAPTCHDCIAADPAWDARVEPGPSPTTGETQ